MIAVDRDHKGNTIILRNHELIAYASQLPCYGPWVTSVTGLQTFEQITDAALAAAEATREAR